jgi:hypothetical protein
VSAPSLTAEQQVVAGKRRCIGFAPHEGTCSWAATVQPALLWCQRCETLRRESLDRQFAEVSALFNPPRVDERSTDA